MDAVTVDLDFAELLRDFAINLVAIVILVFAVYYRRYRRRDHAVGFLAFNVSLFTVAASLTSTTGLNLGVGFGLFAVLSIVRLRSDEATQSEIGYTMIALVIGLLNGLPGLDLEVKVTFSALLVLIMAVVDSTVVFARRPYQRLRVELDTVISDHALLKSEVERRIGATVRQFVVTEIDFVRETMRLDVRADPQ
jgi:hypothetical protein